MANFLRLDINIWSILLIGILIYSAWHRLDHRNPSTRIFILFLLSVGLQNGFEIIGWIFEGQPGLLFLWLNRMGNVLLYIGNPLPVVLWFLYSQSLISKNQDEPRLWKIFSMSALGINAVVTILSVKTGWFFFVSTSNQYQRGPLIWLHSSIVFLIMAISIVLIIIHREKFQHQMYMVLLAYYILPIVGAYLQLRFYGLSMTWPMTTISVLFTYQNILDKHLTTDYLTGSYNRRHFEKIIARKIKQNRYDRKLALIAADIDSFKQINDQFGHATGDIALQSTVEILRKCLRPEDTIARVGGDEFYIVLQLEHPIDLDETINRFHKAITVFNETCSQPFKLQISFGGVLFDQSQYHSAEALLAHADQLMYTSKTARQTIRSAPTFC